MSRTCAKCGEYLSAEAIARLPSVGVQVTPGGAGEPEWRQDLYNHFCGTTLSSDIVVIVRKTYGQLSMDEIATRRKIRLYAELRAA